MLGIYVVVRVVAVFVAVRGSGVLVVRARVGDVVWWRRRVVGDVDLGDGGCDEGEGVCSAVRCANPVPLFSRLR